MFRRNWASQTVVDSPGFAFIRDRAGNVLGFQNLSNGHRYRSPGDFFQSWEPTFVVLLPAAGLIQFNDDIRFIGREIRRRIVKCQVAVFTDTDKRDIDWAGGDQAVQSLAFAFDVGRIPIDQDHFSGTDMPDQAILQIAAETGWMGGWQTDVFIQMKHRGAGPIDPWIHTQGSQEFKLGSSGGGDKSRLPFFTDSCGQQRSSFRCSFLTDLLFGLQYFDFYKYLSFPMFDNLLNGVSFIPARCIAGFQYNAPWRPGLRRYAKPRESQRPVEKNPFS